MINIEFETRNGGMRMLQGLDEVHKDALKEMANIGEK